MIRSAVRLVPPILALSLIAGCASTSTGTAGATGADAGNTSASIDADTPPANGATLDAASFAAAIQRPGVQILDVRTPAEFASGHLPGAVNIDVNGSGFDKAISALPADGEYAVYCRSGNRSATALARMKDLGRGTAYHLGGGIGAWVANGGKVTTS